MKKISKALSALMAVLLIFNIMLPIHFTVSGVDTFIVTPKSIPTPTPTPTPTPPLTKITIGTTPSNAVTGGSSFTLDVYIDEIINNPNGIASFEAVLSYDESVFDVMYLANSSLPSEAFTAGSIVDNRYLDIYHIGYGKLKILYTDREAGISNTHIKTAGKLCSINLSVKEQLTYGIFYSFELGGISVYDNKLNPTSVESSNGLIVVKAPHSITGIEDGKAYNSERAISVNNAAAVTLNGYPMPNNFTVSEEDFYTLEVTDLAGIPHTYSFSIDKTAPTITIDEYSTLPTNMNVVVTAWSEDGMLNAYSHTFTSNGTFQFIAVDEAGNTTVQSITITNIDKDPPVITIGEYSKDPTLGAVTVTASTDEGILNETSYTFTENGTFDFVAIDAAGNETIETVFITNIVTLGDVNNDGNISAIDALRILKSVTKKITLTSGELLAADVNKDGKVNALDALKILKYVTHKITTF